MRRQSSFVVDDAVSFRSQLMLRLDLQYSICRGRSLRLIQVRSVPGLRTMTTLPLRRVAPCVRSFFSCMGPALALETELPYGDKLLISPNTDPHSSGYRSDL
jgi:hypothetical protein